MEHQTYQFKRRRIDPKTKLPQDLGPGAATLYMALSYTTRWRHTLPLTWRFLYKVGIPGLSLDFFSSGQNEDGGIKNEELDKRSLYHSFDKKFLPIVGDDEFDGIAKDIAINGGWLFYDIIVALSGASQILKTREIRKSGERIENAIVKFHEWMLFLFHPNEEPSKFSNLVIHVARYHPLHNGSLENWVSRDLKNQLNKVKITESTFRRTGSCYVIALYEVGSTLVVTLGVIHRNDHGAYGPLRVINAFMVIPGINAPKKEKFSTVKIKVEDGTSEQKIKLEPPRTDERWACPAWAAAIKIGLVVSAAVRDG